MLNDIINYIKYLSSKHNLSISIHNKNLKSNQIICKLTPYNIHRNPYCLYLNSDLERHKQCLEFQQKIKEQCSSDFFCVTCVCGVFEYIVPIKYNSEFLGYICVSGYKGNRNKCVSNAYQNNIPVREITEIYDTHLKNEKPDANIIQTLVKPLALMLAVAFTQSADLAEKSDDSLYEHILSVIHTEAFSKLSIKTIAVACHCSPSMASHLFKRKSGVTINKYITELRMNKAEKLLSTTNSRITDIAYSCGFSDSNYFIYVFSKTHGTSPLKYRKQNGKNVF